MDKKLEKVFLSVISCVLNDRELSNIPELNKNQWKQLFIVAAIHSIVPLVYDKVSTTEQFNNIEKSRRSRIAQSACRIAAMQVSKTQAALNVFEAFNNSGIEYVAAKGIICRKTYPKPDLRLSSDEDIFVHMSNKQTCEEIMTGCGLKKLNESEKESKWFSPNTGLYIELHYDGVFTDETGRFADMNDYYDYVLANFMETSVESIKIRTFSQSDNLIYLTAHAMHHFMHSGVGIRQLCDVILYAKAYIDKIDWKYYFNSMNRMNGADFTAAMFYIAEKKLDFSLENEDFQNELKKYKCNYKPLLKDILDSGVYGSSSQDRLHSGAVTYGAVGKEKKHPYMNTMFPRAEVLYKKYPVLNKHKYLLPFVWIKRIFIYLFAERGKHHNSAISTLFISKRRLKLFKQYKIMKEKPKEK